MRFRLLQRVVRNISSAGPVYLLLHLTPSVFDVHIGVPFHGSDSASHDPFPGPPQSATSSRARSSTPKHPHHIPPARIPESSHLQIRKVAGGRCASLP